MQGRQHPEIKLTRDQAQRLKSVAHLLAAPVVYPGAERVEQRVDVEHPHPLEVCGDLQTFVVLA
jgi:hypothetical protein